MLANCHANKAPPASGLHNDILAGVNLLLLHVLVGQTVASARARDVWFVNASMTNAWLSRLYICMTNYYLYILHPCQSPTLINSRCLLAPSSRASKARQDKQCSQQHIQGYAISQVNLTCTHMITVTQHSLKPQTCHQSYTCLGVPATECIRMQVGCIIYAQTSTVPTYSMILQHTCAAQADLHS